VLDGLSLPPHPSLKNQQHCPVFRGVKPLLHFGKPDAVPSIFPSPSCLSETSRLAVFCDLRRNDCDPSVRKGSMYRFNSSAGVS